MVVGCVWVGEKERNREKNWILDWNKKNSFASARSGETTISNWTEQSEKKSMKH